MTEHQKDPSGEISIRPRVSVLMAVYNGGEHLPQAVDSILSQTFSDFEFIIVNDGSTDDSQIVLDAYAKTDKRIRVLHQENTGLVGALNAGLEEARGEFVARMDADDVAFPDRLKEQVAFLDKNPSVGLLGARVITTNSQGQRTGEWKVPTSPGYVGWRLLFRTVLAHPAVMFRRSVVEKTGPYDPKALHNEDYNLWTRMIWHTRVDNLPKPILLFRRLDTGITNKHYDVQQQNAVWSMCNFHQRLLGAAVVEDVVGCIRMIAKDGRIPEGNTVPARMLVEHLLRLHDAYLKWAVPTYREKVSINQHLSHMLIAIKRDAGGEGAGRLLGWKILHLRIVRQLLRLASVVHTQLDKATGRHGDSRRQPAQDGTGVDTIRTAVHA